LKAFLTKTEVQLREQYNALDEMLHNLDAGAHSLGYLFILNIQATSPKFDIKRFSNSSRHFLVNCTSQQIKHEPQRFARVARKFKETMIDMRTPLKGLRPLWLGLVKFRGSSENLTPLHSDLLQLCILSKCYTSAFKLLAEPVFQILPEQTGLTPKDMLLYYYYGGVAYVGLKDFKSALEFFKMAFSCPAIVLSAIMVESYKKFVLVSLILYGQVQPFPKYTSSVVQRHIKTTCLQYQELANAYSTFNSDELHKLADSHWEFFRKDGNAGLVKQVVQSLYHKNIKRHTQTYLTLSVKDIQESVKLPSCEVAERHILRMIENGQIFATMSQKDGMVSFHEDPELYNTNHIRSVLDGNLNITIGLDKKLRSIDDQIALSTAYIQKTQIQERPGSHPMMDELDEKSFTFGQM